VLDYGLVLIANTVIETRYIKKATGEIFSFRHFVTPPELMSRVTVSHANGGYAAGMQIRITAT
jgi:hypothetical protein